MANLQARILIEGRLQGMNFRMKAQAAAQNLGLVGFVRILSDGRIEIEAQGQKSQLEQLLAWCQQEPHSGNIKSILFRYDEAIKSYSDFAAR